jgi:NADH-quinone oxidoreductase subunit L
VSAAFSPISAFAPILAHAADFAEGARPHDPAFWGWMLLLTPLVGCIVIALSGKRLSERGAGLIGTAAIFLAFGAALACLAQLLGMETEERHVLSGYQYAQAFGVDFRFDIFYDQLAVMMALIVTGVSALIHLYSVAYMRSDAGYRRFFAYLNFFVFSMLLLVLAGNLLLLVIGWGFVGAASYMLISFWYRRQTATRAGTKAFVMNVIGDVGIVVAAYLLWHELHTLTIPTLLANAADPFSVTPSATFTAAALLLLVGAVAKSAQIPLHTWLPDAMEGPTPVSALIHAATMVTAGVYLICRFHPFFELSETAALTAAILGTLTMIVAATTAIVQTDLKRIIAYSTMSQIGYMIAGAGAAAYTASMFHLMTHAFFKALLFMSAGSVIAAMANVQDVRKMGGFRYAMPFTYGCFLIGSLALAGLPPFAGFWSKDEIIAFTLNRGGVYAVLAIFMYVGALLTAIYSMRAVYLVFHGKKCGEAKELEHGRLAHGDHVNPATGEHEDTGVGFPGPDHQIAEREGEMKVAMGTLAFLSVVAGLVQIPGVDHVIESWLEPVFEDSRYAHDIPSVGMQWVGLAIGAVIAVTGIAIANYLYRKRPEVPQRLAESFAGLNSFLYAAWRFDALYELVVVRPVRAVADFCNNFVERYLVDGIVVGATTLAQDGGRLVRRLQTGLTRGYALSMVLGSVAIVIYFLIVAR